MVLAQLALHDGVRQLNIRLRLLIALEHEHAAADIIIDGGRVDGVATEASFADLASLQIAA